MMCVYGHDEEESLCRKVDTTLVHPEVRPGKHHFDGDYQRDRVADPLTDSTRSQPSVMVMRVNRKRRLGALIVAGASALACQSGQPSAGGAATGAAGSLPAGKPSVQAASELQAGEYLTIIGGCNDCHTEGWSESKGKVAPADRMSGMKVGFRGSWGTVYGKNLRRSCSACPRTAG